MLQYNTLKVALSNSQLNKLNSEKIFTEVTLKPSWNVVDCSNDENDFQNKLLLTNG